MARPPLTISDLCHLLIQQVEVMEDATYLRGQLTKPEQLNPRHHSVCLIVENLQTIGGIIEQIDPSTGFIRVNVEASPLREDCRPGVSLPLFDAAYCRQVLFVGDPGMKFERVRFHSPDAFAQPNPQGGTVWRIAESGDEKRSDGKIIPGGWDHEHCAICWATISEREQPFGYVSGERPHDFWLCERCYQRYVPTHDLRFLLEGPDDPKKPRSECDDTLDLLTALMRTRRLDKLSELLDSGTDPNVSNRYGQTPLMVAADEGHAEALKLLVSGGADPNRQTDQGYTALAMAAQRNEERGVELLLAAGASVDLAPTFCGGSILTYVKTGPGRDNPRIETLLRNAGAK